ncbi:MAG: hypothetical protein ACJAVM_002061 [Sulfitobacter sp.]|jgi:hypothetical protein
MKYAIPALVLATPAFAHPGAHLHAADTAQVFAGLALIAVVATTLVVVKIRK